MASTLVQRIASQRQIRICRDCLIESGRCRGHGRDPPEGVKELEVCDVPSVFSLDLRLSCVSGCWSKPRGCGFCQSRAKPRLRETRLQNHTMWHLDKPGDL